MAKPVTKNAADAAQVKEGERKAKHGRDRELDDLSKLLATPQFRRFIWRVMGKCKTFESIWENSARIHFNAGQQDIGHYLMSEIVEANEEALLLMMKEAKQGEY